MPNEDPNLPAHEYLYHETPDARDRMDAFKWLVDRGFGKVAEIIDILERPTFRIFLGLDTDPVTSGELNRPPRELPPAS